MKTDERLAWSAPSVRRLATSEAEFNPTSGSPDSEGFLS
jgi:hypothetical protein